MLMLAGAWLGAVEKHGLEEQLEAMRTELAETKKELNLEIEHRSQANNALEQLRSDKQAMQGNRCH